MSDTPKAEATTPLEPATCAYVPAEASSQATPPSDDASDRATIANASDAQIPSPKVTARERKAWPRVEGYEILQVLGQGSMGIVYKARQSGLKRLVALKMILSGALAGDIELARFHTEAEAIARLRHPHIVQVHEVGEWHSETGGAGLPYLSLEFVSGGSLSRHLKSTPQPPRFAAELLAVLAEAIQYAHDHQVIHRDLKPGNILLEGSATESLASGTVSQATAFHAAPTSQSASTLRDQLFLIPKIADFGLAKQLDEQSSQTMSGAIVGTPSYMAPEQAAGHASAIGPSADIYALGAILYEVLTGRPPFKGTTLYETIEQVRHQEPVPPSRLQPKTPLDLETICLKCLQKEPGKRYGTALELAQDLRRFLAHEPIRARPISKLERTWRWCVRNPFPASLIVLIGVTLLVGLAVSSSLALWAVRGWGEADDNAKIALERKLESDRRAYVAEFRGALQKWEIGRIDEVQEMLKRLEPVQIDDPDLRSFEWHHLQRLCQLDLRTLTGHTGTVHQVACSPDGRWLATAGHDKTVRIWDRATGSVVRTLTSHTNFVLCVAFSPDSKRLASAGADLIIRVWDVVSGNEQAALPGHTDHIRSLVFRPDGLELASGAKDNTVRLWNLSTNQSRVLTDHAGTMSSVVYSADGELLYSAGQVADVLIWNVRTGQAAGKLYGHVGRVDYLAISADGRRLASYGQDQTIRIWDTSGAVEPKSWPIPREEASCIALSPDGTRLVTGGRDHVVHMWNSDTGKELSKLRGHRARVFGVTFSPDGWQILSACADGTVKMWDAAVSQEKTIARAHSRFAYGLAFSFNDHWLATCGGDGAIHIWHAETGIRLNSLAGHRGPCPGVWFLPQSAHLVSIGLEDGTIRLWDVETCAELARLHDAGQPLRAGACSPNGKWFAAYAKDGTVLVYDLTSRMIVRQFACSTGKDIWHLCFHPTEPWLAIANGLEYPTIRNVESGEFVSEWKSGEPGSGATAFSPDGRLFAAGEDLSLWELQSAKRRLALRKDATGQFSLTFTPAGLRIVGGSADSMVRVWDAATGADLLTLSGHTGFVRGVALSSDGLLLASVGDDGLLQIWDARPLTPERRELREAASLVRFLFGRAAQREEVLKQIREHPGISESVRGRALQLVEAQAQDSN